MKNARMLAVLISAIIGASIKMVDSDSLVADKWILNALQKTQKIYSLFIAARMKVMFVTGHDLIIHHFG